MSHMWNLKGSLGYPGNQGSRLVAVEKDGDGVMGHTIQFQVDGGKRFQ
jgi:hypothetical protein